MDNKLSPQERIAIAVVFVGAMVLLWAFSARFGRRAGDIVSQAELLSSQRDVTSATVDCDHLPEVRIIVQDAALQGFINQGDEITYVKDWYKCYPAKPGDVVVHNFSPLRPPVVRVVRGTAGNRFQVVPDDKARGWNVKLNDQVMEVKGQTYFFGANGIPPILRLFEGQNNGQLRANDVLLFSMTPPGLNDAGTFGLANRTDLMGKVILPAEIERSLQDAL